MIAIFKNWSTRDWIWIIILLVFVIIGIISFILYSENAGAILSITLTITATILSTVTIVYSILQNNTMDNKLYDLNKKLDKISELKHEMKDLSSRIKQDATLDILNAISVGKELTQSQIEQANTVINEVKTVSERLRENEDLFDIL